MRNKLVVGLLLCCCSVVIAGGVGEKATQDAASNATKADASFVAPVKTAPQAANAQRATFNTTGTEAADSRMSQRVGTEDTGVYTRTLISESTSPGSWSNGRGTDNTCASAITIADPTNYTDVLVATTPFGCNDDEANVSCGLFITCGCIWYQFTATATEIHIDTCTDPGTDTADIPDTQIALFSGSCGNLTELACNDDAGCLVSPDGTSDGLGSEIDYAGLTIGNTYYVQVCFTRWCAGVDCDAAEGDYQLTLQNDSLGLCDVVCVGDEELEINPIQDAWHMNDGCNEPGLGTNYPVMLAEIDPCQTVCGSLFKAAPGSNLASATDTDWYKVALPAGTYTLDVTVEAEFDVTYSIYGPDPTCPVGAAVATTTQGPCSPVTIQAPSASGEYWIVVEPAASLTYLDLYKEYSLVVATSGCPDAVGACCFGTPPTCTEMTEENCLTQPDGAYWGDGVDCADITCWECPGDTNPDSDDECTNDVAWTDNWNDGCATAQARYRPIVDNSVECGWGGTHIDLTDTWQNNLRDNDWWGIRLGEPTALGITFKAEFPAEVMVWEMGEQSPCDGFESVIDTIYVPAGTELAAGEFAPCAFGRPDAANPSYDQLFCIVVRAVPPGTPNEIPCGQRYWLGLVLDDCGLGACCFPPDAPAPGCADGQLAQDCFDAGGNFFGEGSTCDDPAVCCPCTPDSIAEGDTVCAQPDNVNSGCIDTSTGYAPTGAVIDVNELAVPPEIYCGSSGLVWSGGGGFEDYDMYEIVAPFDCDIEFNLFAEFQPLMVFYEVPPSWDPCPSTGDAFWDNFFYWPPLCRPECELNTTLITAVPAGTKYHVGLGYYRDCGGDVDSCDTSGGPDQRKFYHCYFNITTPTAACCFSDGSCDLLNQTECEAQGGVYQTGVDSCDPNPCCTVDCTDTEGEPTCEGVNDGCWDDPAPGGFSTQLTASGDTVCGTHGMAIEGDYIIRDGDWYEINYVDGTGDLKVCAQSEYPVDIFLLTPDPGTDCDNLAGWWVTAVSGNCSDSCLWIADTNTSFTTGTYYIVIAPSFDHEPLEVIECGSTYFATLYLGQTAACCLENDSCYVLFESECTAEGGTWLAGTPECDPNPCCQVECTDNEGEPDCGLPTDTVNGGCAVDPPLFDFDTLQACGDSVCGSVELTAIGAYLYRDTDWFVFDHTGGDLSWCVEAEFFAQIAIIQPGDPDPCDYTDGWMMITENNCAAADPCLTWEAAPAGQYLLYVMPWFGGYEVACGSTYKATVCPPDVTWCLGDMDCSGGSPTFADILYFAAAVGNEGGWEQYYRDRHAGEDPPCPWLLGDYGGSAGVDFADIVPFANSVGQACIPYTP